jgi:FMN phosphatase YigB (HAD superfamily)
MPDVLAVVTDLDNTLYSWVDYIVPALEALVDSLFRSTGIPRIEIIRSLKRVYTRHGTNEYAFAIQETDFWRSLAEDLEPEFMVSVVLEPARRAFDAERRKYLQLYRGVAEGLLGLQARNVPIFALTDAPRNPAEARMKSLSVPIPGENPRPLVSFFEALYCQAGYAVPDAAPTDIRDREASGYYRVDIPVTELGPESEKPSPDGVLAVCRSRGFDPGRVLVVGDNLSKDIVAAREAGAVDVWAEYGTYVSPEYRERLNLISARDVTRRHLSDTSLPAQDAAIRPTYRISNFEMVLDIVDGRA